MLRRLRYQLYSRIMRFPLPYFRRVSSGALIPMVTQEVEPQTNDFRGETAILCDVPRTATVQAKTDLMTLMISRGLFFQLVSQFPSMSMEIMPELARRVERTTAQLREAVSQRPA